MPGGGDVHFHQIHKDCGSRIRYQKVCPVHGEVTKDEIVSGYEYQKNEYVELDPDEVAKLRAPNDQSINIDVFTKTNMRLLASANCLKVAHELARQARPI